LYTSERQEFYHLEAEVDVKISEAIRHAEKAVQEAEEEL